MPLLRVRQGKLLLGRGCIRVSKPGIDCLMIVWSNNQPIMIRLFVDSCMIVWLIVWFIVWLITWHQIVKNNAIIIGWLFDLFDDYLLIICWLFDDCFFKIIVIISWLFYDYSLSIILIFWWLFVLNYLWLFDNYSMPVAGRSASFIWHGTVAHPRDGSLSPWAYHSLRSAAEATHHHQPRSCLIAVSTCQVLRRALPTAFFNER